VYIQLDFKRKLKKENLIYLMGYVCRGVKIEMHERLLVFLLRFFQKGVT
jgi:hypothetical protein